MSKVTFQAWPSIEQLHNLVKSVETVIEASKKSHTRLQDFAPYDICVKEEIVYRGKIKLHGQNAAINIQDGRMRIQTRSQFTDQDSALGKLVLPHESYFKKIARNAGFKKFIIFGELCGPKIQKNVALTHLKCDIFVIFSLMIDNIIYYEPDDIKMLCNDLPNNFYILDWYTEKFPLNFCDNDQMQGEIEKLNKIVECIDNQDPWVLQNFDIKGPGEGLVLYPVSLGKNNAFSLNVFSSFVFKAKGKQHQGVKNQNSVQLLPQKAENVEKFAQMMCSEPRLEQGLKEVGLSLKGVASFVQWMRADVEKEGKDEAEISEINMKDGLSAVSKIASEWYMNQYKKSESIQRKDKEENE